MLEVYVFAFRIDMTEVAILIRLAQRLCGIPSRDLAWIVFEFSCIKAVNASLGIRNYDDENYHQESFSTSTKINRNPTAPLL